MNKFLLSVFTFLVFSLAAKSQCVTNVDFNTWSKAGVPGNGNWVVQGGGTSVRQTVNGDNTYFISPFDLMNVRVTGNFRSTDDDDDWMGFVFSFLNPMGPTNDYDCWLFDWKQDFQGAAPRGKSLNRVFGTINNYAPFNNHQNTAEFTVVANDFGGPGWVRNFNHAFELRLTYTRAQIYVDGNLVFDHPDCYKPGRFGFYNLSQEDCYYSNFQYDLFIDFFVDDNGKVCLGDTTDFEFVNPCFQASLAQYQSLSWDFGDGNTVVNNNPTFANANVKHRYATAGNYTARLTVTDFNGCSSTATRQIEVRNPITLTPVLTSPPCNGGTNGSLRVNPTGGFGPYTYNWSTGQTTQTAIGQGAGTYTVTVTDDICTTTGQYTLNQPPPLTATTSKTDANCGLANGTASIVLSGGTTPYSAVNWGGGFVGTTVTGLAPGTRIADFTDANGCSSLLQYSVVIGSLPCGVTSTVSKVDVACFGASTGSATLNVTGGTGTQTITWNPGGLTGATISNRPAGTYTYSFTDNNPAHSFTGSITISQPTAAMVAQLSTVGISCTGVNNGQALASVPSGGTPPYTYTWSGGQPNNPVANNLAPGNITVTVTDSKGCTATATGNVSNVPSLAVTFQTTIDSCFNSGKGKAIANVVGGTPPYNYSWSNFETQDSNLNIRAGSYTVTITDNNNCTVAGTAVITTPPALTQTYVKQNISCFGNTNGSISVTTAGGTPGYNFAWSPAHLSGTSQTGLAAGIYRYTITDAHNCVIFGGDTIFQPNSALTATTSHTNVTCNGLNNGTITVNTSGGKPPYTFLGNPLPAGPVTIPNLAPNTYAGNIVDSNGCTFAVSETVTEPAVLSVTETHTNVSCNAGTNGSITTTITGGTTPYTFDWGGGVTTQNRTNLAAGTFAITVTDANNCTGTISVTITEPTALTASETHQNVDCFGNATGSIDVTATGGTGTLTFLWNDANTSEDRTNIPDGNYAVTITDANSCTTILSVTVTEPTALTATTSHTDVTCNGLNNGTITVNTSGGTPPYTFLGNPLPAGLVTIPSLAPNTYAGNITDANGCTFAVSETVVEPAVLSVTETHTDVNCSGGNDGSITTTITGGTTPYTFDWGGGVTTQNRTAIPAGSYTLTVTDANSCTATVAVTVTEPAGIVASETHQNVDCFGNSTGSIDVTATGGASAITFLWNDNVTTSEDRANIPAGNYSVTITDVNNCTRVVSVTISEPAVLTAPTSHTDVTCFGLNNGTITVTISGGTAPYSFLGNPLPAGATTIPNLAPNTYAGQLTDANNCSVNLIETIVEPTQLSATETHQDASCFGANDGDIFVTPSGGTAPYNYDWGGGVTTQGRSNIPAGNYAVTVSDANACTTTLSVVIAQPTSPPLAVVPVDATCFGVNGSATASPTEGTAPHTFTWSNSPATTATASLPAGSYSVTSTASNGCQQVNTFVINQPTEIVVAEVHTDVNCNAATTGSITLTANGGAGNYTYLWQPNVSTTNSASSIGAGTYGITVTDQTNCTAAVSVTVTEPAAIAVTATTAAASCFGLSNGSIAATATGGTPTYSYTATDGAATFNSSTGSFNALPAGSYTIVATDINSCTSSTNAVVSEPSQINVSAIASDVTCYQRTDGSINATATGGSPGYNYALSSGASNASGLFTNLASGSYSLTVTDNGNCSATTTAQIVEPGPVEVTVVPNPTETSLGNPVQLNISTNQSGTINYSWIPATGLSCSNCDNPIFDGINTVTYTVNVSTSNGCSGSSQITATVIPDYTVYIPNAFSPNNDGGNDYWQVYGNIKAVKQFSIMVFNRWGEKVYETEDVNFKWDGFASGKQVPAGVYVYSVKYIFIDNHTDTNYKGSLTILK
jgi:gliding motility-associated-like protein